LAEHVEHTYVDLWECTHDIENVSYAVERVFMSSENKLKGSIFEPLSLY